MKDSEVKVQVQVQVQVKFKWLASEYNFRESRVDSWTHMTM